MFNIILLFLLIMSGSFFYVTVLNKSAEDGVSVTFFAIIAIFFPFIIINKINLGFIAVYLISALVYMFSIIYIIKNKSCFNYKKFLTPGMLTYYALLILLYFVTYNSFVSLWDELRLWGAVPKYMYFSNQSYLGINSAIIPDMQKYPPAMAIIQMIFEKSLGEFKENILFFAYAVFGAALFIPALKNKGKIAFAFIPFYIILIYILPQTYYNSLESDSEFYYTTLFIDSFLGLIIAYLTYIVTIENLNSKIVTLSLVLGLIALALLKETGIFFVGLFLLYYVIMNTKNIIRNKKYLLGFFVISIPILFYLLFKVKLNISITNSSSSFNFSNIINLIINPSEEQIYYFNDFIYTIFNRNIVTGANITNLFNFEFSFTVIHAIILNALLALIILLIIEKDNIKKYIIGNIFVLISTVIYSFGLLFVYMFKIGGGSEFPSFQRYISTMLLAQLTFIILSMLYNAFNVKNKNNVKASTILIFMLICIITLFPVGKAKETGYEYFKSQAEDLKIDIVNKINNDKTIENSPSSLFVIMNNTSGEDVLIHHQLFYRLLDSNVYVKNQLGEIDWITEPSIDNLKSKLVNYDYMFLYIDYEDEFINNYSSLFDDKINLPMMSTYKVEKTDDDISLKILVK